MNEDKQDSIEIQSNSISNDLISTIQSDEKQDLSLKFNQRRFNLLNNPIYGIILIFLDKFRSFIDIQDYPLHLLEENLLNDEETISRRLIDFHFNLLKRISLGKGAQREKFDSILTKFAYRFDFNDGEYLQTNGYLHADIDVKLRILKNLLETQFDHNATFKTAVLDKPSFEIRSQAFGRDRSGAFYWLIQDTECFMRLFRENIDDERTWTNVAKDKDEFENFLQILITDYVVRKKYPEWKFAYEPFNTFEISNDFQNQYIPIDIEIKKEEQKQEMKAIRHRSKSPIITLKKERLTNPVENKCSSSPAAAAAPSSPLPSISIKNEIHSNDESMNSNEKLIQHSINENNSNLLTQEINNNQNDKQFETNMKISIRKKRKSKKRQTKSKQRQQTKQNDTIIEQQQQQSNQIPSRKGRKRKQIINDNNENQFETKPNDETSQDKHMNAIGIESEFLFENDNLPIALRRSKRTKKLASIELPSIKSSPIKSISSSPMKKKLTNGKTKVSNQTKKSSTRKSARRRRRRGRRANASSDDDDEQQASDDDDDDEYNSDDYLLNSKVNDEMNDDDLLEEDNDDEYVPCRSAKTVAKRRGQLNEHNLIDELSSAASECRVCSKSDRPETLLLCDDCDDPYHLECLKPILLSVPDGDWFCPLCEHKRLCERLIEKYQQFLKDYDELQAKKNQCMSKRTNRLANVMLNLDRMMKRSSKNRKTNGIVNSDEDEEEEENDDDADDDDDSVYGFKDDGSIDETDKSKRSMNSVRNRRNDETTILGVRSCRRKPQNYRFDDYDKKMKEAMMEEDDDDDDELEKHSHENNDNNDGDEDEDDKLISKKRSGYEKDEDFDILESKNDDEFAPDQNNSDDSASEEDYEDEESSDDKWKTKRRSSTRKKLTTRTTRRRTKKTSDDDDDDDDSLSDIEFEKFQTFNTINETYQHDDERRRSSRTTTQNYVKDDDDSDEDYFENGRPPTRRMKYKKRRASDESFVDDDDDYEKLARKRKIVKYSKSLHRSSITDRIKKLVDDDDDHDDNDDDDDDDDDEKSTKTKLQIENQMQIDDKQIDTNCQNVQQQNDENEQQQRQPSDDDDFPDEQEIFQANALRKLQNTLIAPKSTNLRPTFTAPTHSYQHAIIDPTARFAMIRPPVRANSYPSNGHELTQQPSDSNQTNGHNSPTSSNIIIQDL